MKLRRTYWILALVTAAGLIAADTNSAGTMMEAAHKKEVVDGDLKGAIKAYLAIVAKYAKTDRAVAAMALVHMAKCYQKTGDAGSRKIYEQVVKDYADQKDAVAMARAGLGGAVGAAGGGKITTERVAEAGDIWEQFDNIAMDRPLSTFYDSGDLMLRDLLTGETRNVTRDKPLQKGLRGAGAAVISADGELLVYPFEMGDDWVPTTLAEIRSIRSDGTGMRTHITGLGKNAAVLALSPDKKTAIVWDRRPQGAQPLLLLSLLDDSVKPFGEGLRPYGGASFSPDGKQMAFSEPGKLSVSNADGNGVHPLLNDPNGERVVSPFWSPDGKWIVFLSGRTGSTAIWAIPSIGGSPRVLKEDKDIARLHGLTHDGGVYFSTNSSEYDVATVQLNPSTAAISGQSSRLIDTFLGRNGRPLYSPDGKWITWLSERGVVHGQSAAVVVRPAAGGEEKVVLTQQIGIFNSFFSPKWFPDSKALLIRRRDKADEVFERVEIADGRTTELYRGPSLDFRLFEAVSGGNALLGLGCDGLFTAPKPCELIRYDLGSKSETKETLNEISSISNSYPGTDMAISPDGKWLAVIGNLMSGLKKALFVKPMAGGPLLELDRATDFEGLQGGLAWMPDSRKIIYAVSGPDKNGSWNPLEMKAISVEGGTPALIPVPGALGGGLSVDPSGRLAYTVETERQATWVAHNLLPTN